MLQFSCSVTSDSWWSHGLQHNRLPCPAPVLRVYANSCPLNWWCHPSSSSSAIPFSSCFQSFPTSGSFPMSQIFASGGQSIGVSVSTSVLPMNIQDWFPLGLTGLTLKAYISTTNWDPYHILVLITSNKLWNNSLCNNWF